MTILNEIEKKMNTASSALIEDVKHIDGDIIILGVSGKIGYNLSALLMDALSKAGIKKNVYGVARFSDGNQSRDALEAIGVKTLVADFMNDESLKSLPQVKNVIFMVGYKFGSTGNESYTWALNSYLPGRIAETYKDSNIVVFSTGCVYPLVSVKDAAPSEEQMPEAIGEYAQSCLGRERIFEHFSKENQTPMAIYRLNYAIDVRYGVLVEIAKDVYNNRPVDVTMGQVNVIWQPDASEMAIRSLLHATVPANVINITGPETLSVRWIAERFAERFGKAVTIVGEESENALLSNASKSHELFGYPQTSIREMIDTIATWIELDGSMIDKPTHFQEREGKY
ncbi:MAG: NAD-dependent epimerase/dehydratase family protein [Erysipelothrix sp.]